MKVFISLKVPRGDAALIQFAAAAADAVRQAGHEAFVAPLEISAHGISDPVEFMPFVRQHIVEAGLVIVLYHPELRGGLIELGIAYAHHLPVWVCYPAGQRISSSALGCADLMIPFSQPHDLGEKILAALPPGL